MKRTPCLIGLALALMVAVIAVYGSGWLFASKTASADDLERAALAGGDASAQKAAADLLALDRTALPHIRRVLQQSKSPEVRAIMLQGIGQHWDYESMGDLFNALDDESQLIRTQAWNSAQQMLYMDPIYKPGEPRPARAAAIAKAHERWERMQKSPRFKMLMEKQKQAQASVP